MFDAATTPNAAIYGGEAITFTIYDRSGSDTINFSIDTYNQDIELRVGFVSDTYGLIGNMAIAAGTAIENYIAAQGNDPVMGNSFGNRVQGRDGSDTLYGGGGSDVLRGSSGNDLFNGGSSVDTLTGGYGADRFYHNGQNAHGRDTITDFNHA